MFKNTLINSRFELTINYYKLYNNKEKDCYKFKDFKLAYIIINS